jgi:tetratricopeptide (TPR) repeat protein
MISSYVVMFLSFAFTDFLVGEKENLFIGKSEDNYNTFLSKDSVLSKITKATLFILIGSGSIYLLYFGNVRAMNSSTDTVEMMISEDTLEGKMESFKKALDTPMEKYEIREQFSQKIYREGFNPSQDRASLFLAFSLAEAEMEKSVKENPLDFRAHLFLGKLYSSDAQFSLDPVKLALAEKYLEKCIELSPTNQQGYWFLGEIKVTKGEKDEAFRLFEKAVELEPEFGRSHWYLAMIERIRENYAEALVEVQLAEETGYKWKSLEGIMSVVTIYQGLNDNLAIANLYQEAVILFPDDASVWQNFASSLVNIGEIEKAKIAIMKVSEIDPSLASQTDEFLKLLEGGNLFEEVEIEI